MGAQRFADENGITLEEAEVQVKLYRERMSKVVEYWNKLSREISICYQAGENLELTLPSGRLLRYGRLKRMRELAKDGKTKGFRYFAKLSRFGKMRDTAIYGAHLAEHMSQTLARDVFCDMMLRIEAAGLPVIFHVHDEMVVEVPEAGAEESLAKMLQIMHTPPTWAPDLPVAAEGGIHTYYSK